MKILTPTNNITADALLLAIVVVTVFDGWYTTRMLRRFGREIELNWVIRRFGVLIGLVGVSTVVLAALWLVGSAFLDGLVLAVRLPLAARQFWFWRKQWPLLSMR